MQYIKEHIGLFFIVAGVLLLAGLHLFHFTFVNALLLLPLGLILGGIVVQVWVQKRQSDY